VGIAGLTPDEQAKVPDIDRSNTAYAEHLKQFFAQHPGGEKRSFDRFLDVQLTWDETMADTAARYLRENPGRRMVVMAGSGHIANRWGIPDRLQRRLPDAAIATVVFADGKEVNERLADYLVFSPEAELPQAGLLGLYLDTTGEGVKVRSVADDSAAGAAGIKTGDLLVAVDGQAVPSYSALRMAMLNMKPGDKVRLGYKRKALIGEPAEKTAEVVLR
jgi:C-terminal processing protease CtpA/Prc